MIRPLRRRHLRMVALTAALVAPLYLAARPLQPRSRRGDRPRGLASGEGKVTGRVVAAGDLLLLHADPKGFHRLAGSGR